MGGSLEDEKLAEMVRDFIESEPTSQNPIQITHRPTFLSLQEVMGKVTDCEREVHDQIVKYLKEIGMEGVEEEEETKEMYNNVLKKMVMKWIVLRLKMETYEASFCKSSWVSAFGPPFPSFSTLSGFKIAGDYEFIDVMIEESGKKTRLIIDMDFRSQFEIVRPTESYTELKNLLPKVFVGSENKLNKIINVICSAAKESLTRKGLHIPPWRKVGYIKSKWFSHNCQNSSLSSIV